MHRGTGEDEGQLWRVWGECFCASLCAEGLHIPHVPVPRGAALPPAPMTGLCHRRFPAAQRCSATLLSDGKLQLALSRCRATPDQCTVMQMEAGAGPLCAASSASPKIGAVQSSSLILSAADGTISAR